MNWSQLSQAARARHGDAVEPGGCLIHIAGADRAVVEALVRHGNMTAGAEGGRVRVAAAGSFGYDHLEPIAAVCPGGHCAHLYSRIDLDTLASLVRDAVAGRPPLTPALCSLDPDRGDAGDGAAGQPLFQLQQRIVLRRCGLLDPEDLLACVALGQGYSALAQVLETSPPQVIERLAAVGLRGRGGAGFPTAQKWQACRKAAGDEKIIVCNAVDGDPKARTARLLLGGDPHSVLEGLLIGAYAVGAARCIICVDRQEENALQRLDRALSQMREYGLLGGNILGSGFRAEIEVKPVTGSLVAGEQTALLRSLQGRQAMPHVRTGHSAEKGLDDRPTLVHNIETFAHVAAIFQQPGHLDRAAGRTKVVTIADQGADRKTIEVPLGISLRRIAGAAIAENSHCASIKALQVGGPSGAFFAGAGLDTAFDFESLAACGAFMGSGTIEIITEGVCAVATARDVTVFLQTQSCGQCVFCREGTLQLSDILESITACTAQLKDLDLITELGTRMKTGCICGLGRTAAVPALSSLALFRNEFEAHVKEKRCLAHAVTSCTCTGSPGQTI